MRRVALLLLLLAGDAAAVTLRCPRGGRLRGCKRSVAPAAPLVQVLPQSGVGILTADANACDTFQADLTGNYTCVRGDLTQRSSAAGTMSTVGTVTTVTGALCPNGADCTAQTRFVLLGNGQYLRTAAGVTPAQNFTICYAGQNARDAGDEEIFTIWGGGTDAILFRMASGSLNLIVGSTTGSTGVDFSVGGGFGFHAACASYTYVGDGTSQAEIVLNGALVATSSTMRGPPVQTALSRMAVGGLGVGGAYWRGTIHYVMYTAQALSTARKIEITKALYPRSTAAGGQTVTTTRVGGRACPTANGAAYTHLAQHLPCRNGNGYVREASTWNLVPYSRDLSHASWTKSNVTVVGHPRVVGPDSVPAANNVFSTAANGTVMTAVTGAPAATRNLSLWAKRVTGGADFIDDPVLITLNGGTTYPVDIAPLINTSTWTRITTLNAGSGLITTGADPTIGVKVVGNGDQIYLDGVQLEPGDQPTSNIWTVGGAASRSADSYTLTNPLPSAGSPFCVCGYPTPTAWGAGPETRRGIAGFGNTYAGANSAGLWIDATGQLAFGVWDASASVKQVTTSGLALTGSHKVTGCASGGALTLYLDDALQTVSASGAGTGALSALGTWHLAELGTGTNSLEGAVARSAVSLTQPGCY